MDATEETMDMTHGEVTHTITAVTTTAIVGYNRKLDPPPWGSLNLSVPQSHTHSFIFRVTVYSEPSPGTLGAWQECTHARTHSHANLGSHQSTYWYFLGSVRKPNQRKPTQIRGGYVRLYADSDWSKLSALKQQLYPALCMPPPYTWLHVSMSLFQVNFLLFLDFPGWKNIIQMIPGLAGRS